MFDNRGAGRSSVPEGPYTIRQMADDTIALLDALGIKKAHVVGASMGGMIAQEMAINYYQRVDRLVLACTRAKPGQIRQLMAPVDRFLRESSLGKVERSLLTMPWGMTPTFLADEDKVMRSLELTRHDPYTISTEGYLAQHSAVMGHDTSTRLHQIVSQTLLLVGAEDILTPAAESAEIARHISGSILRVLPRGGHGFFSEYPNDVNAALLDFLR